MDRFAVDGLSVFGVVVMAVMLVCYACEKRHPLYTLAFTFSCLLSAVYGFLQGAWPFGVMEVIWSGVAFRRWLVLRRSA